MQKLFLARNSISRILYSLLLNEGQIYDAIHFGERRGRTSELSWNRGVLFSSSPLQRCTWQIQYSSDKRLEIGRNGECMEIWSRAERKLKELDTLCVLLGSHSERQVLWGTWSCPRHLSLFSSRTWFPYSERTLLRAMRLLPQAQTHACV